MIVREHQISRESNLKESRDVYEKEGFTDMSVAGSYLCLWGRLVEDALIAVNDELLQLMGKYALH